MDLRRVWQAMLQIPKKWVVSMRFMPNIYKVQRMCQEMKELSFTARIVPLFLPVQISMPI